MITCKIEQKSEKWACLMLCLVPAENNQAKRYIFKTHAGSLCPLTLWKCCTMGVYFQTFYIYLFICGAAGFLSCSHNSSLFSLRFTPESISVFHAELPRPPPFHSQHPHTDIYHIPDWSAPHWLWKLGDDFRCQSGGAPFLHSLRGRFCSGTREAA